jgi:carboxylesterase type B
VYGYSYSNITTDVAGNQGLFDQVEALKFFRSLSEPLHGDLDSVTMWGWQSGGWSVGFHLFSTHSNGLFQQAIMESGSALSPLLLFPEEAAAVRFRKFAAFSNCADVREVVVTNKEEGEKEKKEFSYDARPDTMDCVMKLTHEQIQNSLMKMMSNKREMGFLPVEDTRFFLGNPFDMITKSDFGTVKSILMGVNNNEGGILLPAMFPDVYPLLSGAPKPMDLNQLLEHSKSSGGGDNANSGQAQLMLPMFFRGVDKNDPVAVRNHLQQLIRDALIVCLDNMFMEEYLQRSGRQIFYYLFDQRPSESPFAEWLTGSQHADHLQYVHGYPFKASLAQHYKKQEADLSKKTMGMWGSFMKHGCVRREQARST